MAPPKADNPKLGPWGMRFTQTVVDWAERNAAKAKIPSWRSWLQDHIEAEAVAEQVQHSTAKSVITSKKAVNVNRAPKTPSRKPASRARQDVPAFFKKDKKS